MTTALLKAQEAMRARREAGIPIERIGACPLASCCLHPVRPHQRGEECDG